MTKLRKQRRRKKFKHNINRKRLRNRIYGVGTIACKEIKESWDNRKSIKSNLSEMGLSFDPNVTIKIPNSKAELKVSMTNSNEDWHEEPIEENKLKASKSFVMEQLEKDAKAPRVRKLRLPNSQVEWLTYLLNKYGSDYKAMARDKKNYYQETWKQIRAKIKQFRGIPEQFEEYLKSRKNLPALNFDNDDNEDMSD